MRLTTAISSPHRLDPANHHKAKSRFFLKRALLQLRSRINPDQMGLIGGCPGCLEANLPTTDGCPGPSHLGTWETTNLNRPEADHEDRDPSPETPISNANQNPALEGNYPRIAVFTEARGPRCCGS